MASSSGWQFPAESTPRSDAADSTFRNRTNHSDDPRPASPNADEQTPPRTQYETRQCRICFEDVHPTFKTPMESMPSVLRPPPEVVYEDEDGRLLRPCRCRGSSQYVHEKCLNAWRTNDPTNPRNFYRCPTCGYNYQLSRVAWANFLASSAVRFAMSVSILLVTVFFLGFIADPIINLYYNPWGLLPDLNPFSSPEPVYHIRHADDEGTWIEHFLKGFTSLGLLGFLKVLWANPFGWLRASGIGTGRRAGTTGRERAANVSWIVVAIGVLTVLYGVWKFVDGWSQLILKRATQHVLDVSDSDIEPGLYERWSTKIKVHLSQQARWFFRDAAGRLRWGSVSVVPVIVLLFLLGRAWYLGAQNW